LRGTLVRRGLGRAASERAVDGAFGAYEDTATRGLAVANGTVVRGILERAARANPRYDRPAVRRRLATALHATRTRALADEEVRPSRRPARRAGSAVREHARRELGRAGERAAARARERFRGPLSELPAGLPVAPVPGYWYATVNVWYVEVRGRYERFAVRTDGGRPGEEIVYVRDGRTVSLDVDGDGRPERLGRATRVDLSVTTAVAVAVPPGGVGVGDTGGDADERSAGWPGGWNETTYAGRP
jgi:hypothetical protein